MITLNLLCREIQTLETQSSFVLRPKWLPRPGLPGQFGSHDLACSVLYGSLDLLCRAIIVPLRLNRMDHFDKLGTIGGMFERASKTNEHTD
jgi:hypothetical protein